jgi:hypothetical protein
MIMIIFGAGASYDSVPSQPPDKPHAESRRPPLANDLFHDDFAHKLADFPQCKPIIPDLMSIHGKAVERELERLQEQGNSDPERKRQLAAIRYYLQGIIWDRESTWYHNVAKGVTNHLTLFDRLRNDRADDDPLLLVTFNYDQMIENALSSSPFNLSVSEFQHYIENNTFFKLFKLHGSVNWAREVDSKISNIEMRDQRAVVPELIKLAPDLKVSDRYRIVNGYPIGTFGDIPLYPAMAIPVETKSNFECPSEHLKCLCEHLPNVTKIVTIGWAAQEQHFLKLLKDNLTEELSVFAVAHGKLDAESVLLRIKAAGIGVRYGEAAESGFTATIVSHGFERFFKMAA